VASQHFVRFDVRARWTTLALLAAVMVATPAIPAKDKKAKTPPPAPKDEIQVVGHIPFMDGAVRRFVSTQHYSSFYLYAEHDAGKTVTLIDVTKTDRPSVLADVSYPSNAGSDSLIVVAGTAVLVSDGQPAASAAAPQTVRIMDFSDPENPRVAREFIGVTAMSRDDSRGLIFIANGDGIWILQQRLALDPAVEKAYADYVTYNR
jgi:hypothetical protein